MGSIWWGVSGGECVVGVSRCCVVSRTRKRTILSRMNASSGQSDGANKSRI